MSEAAWGANGGGATSPIRAQRVAELVADVLRRRIIGPDMADGASLPKEDDLRREFGVGRPAIREALRLLESEGLVTIRRGNQGGPVAKKPRADNIAYTIGLALTAQGVHSSDVGNALRLLEPACAMACAQRDDRTSTVVPVLRRIVELSRDEELQPGQPSRYSREFHEELVNVCGNETLGIVVGALEHLWSCHVASSTEAVSQPSRTDNSASIREHERIVDLIEAGDGPGALNAVSRHLARVQLGATTSTSDSPIALSVLNAVVRH